MSEVLLPDHVIDFADNVAATRRAMAFMRGRKHKNNFVGRFELQFANDRLGARCEAAGKLYLNPIIWHWQPSEDPSDLPDLGDFIDVKGIRESHHNLILQKDTTKRDWAYLLVDASAHPHYRMIGWIWGRDGTKNKYLDDKSGKDRPAYFVPQEDIIKNTPETLLELVRGKSK